MNRLLIGLAVLTVLAVFIGYAAVVAGARADRRSEDFEGGAAAPSTSGRTSLRVVGSPTAGTCKPRPARGCCEADAHRGTPGRETGTQTARPCPPDGSSAA